MIFSPGETNVICMDLDKSLAFYRDALGYRVVEEEGGAIRLALGGRFLLLLPLASRPAFKSPYCERAEITFDLRSDDLAAAVHHLIGCNVLFEKPWQPGDDYIVIKDPDGLRIEVVVANKSFNTGPLTTLKTS